MFQELMEIITHLVFFIGLLGIIIGFIFGFLPVINRYKLPIQVVSLLVFSYGAYLEGILANKKKHQEQVAILEQKLKDAKIKTEKVNTKIVKEVLTKREVVKEKGDDVIKYIDREIVKYDSNCPIPESAVLAHNAAAMNKKIEELLPVTPTTPVETKTHNDAAKQVDTKPKLLLPKK